MEKLILLIDDDEDEHELLLAAIQKTTRDFIFLSAFGADEALSVLQQMSPDLIFLDINMPLKDGFACLKEIKQASYSKKIPVQMYSTSFAETDRKKAIELGASGYLVKSHSFDELCIRLKEVLIEHKIVEERSASHNY